MVKFFRRHLIPAAKNMVKDMKSNFTDVVDDFFRWQRLDFLAGKQPNIIRLAVFWQVYRRQRRGCDVGGVGVVMVVNEAVCRVIHGEWMRDRVRQATNAMRGLENMELVHFVARFFAQFVDKRLPRRLIELYVAAKLHVLAKLFMKMKDDARLWAVGPKQKDAGGVVVLSWLGVNMRHGVSIAVDVTSEKLTSRYSRLRRHYLLSRYPSRFATIRHLNGNR